MNTLAYTDELINDYDKEALISQLRGYHTVNYTFLSTLTLDQLNMVKDLEEICSRDEKEAQRKALIILNNSIWPDGLNAKEMDYSLFTEHFANGCTGDTAFYYYLFDKCIPRRGRNKNKLFMNRLATFAKASFRELWEEAQNWTINGVAASLTPNKESSKKRALLPQDGEFAADHIITSLNSEGEFISAEVEEKPWLSDISQAVEKYKDPKSRYNANYLMVHLEPVNKFYIHNYSTGKTSEMIPENNFPGYPAALTNIY